MSRDVHVANLERLATQIATLLAAVDDVERWSDCGDPLPFVTAAGEKAEMLERQLRLLHERMCERRYEPMSETWEHKRQTSKKS